MEIYVCGKFLTESQVRETAREMILAGQVPDKGYQQDFFKLFNEELRKFIADRRASRTAHILRMGRGEVRYGNFSYRITVVSPEGEEYSLTSSGWHPVWNFAAHRQVWYRETTDGKTREEKQATDLIPYFPSYGVNGWKYDCASELVAVDVDRLPDEGKNWVWAVYLPDGWSVKGGSTAYHGDQEAISERAWVSKDS